MKCVGSNMANSVWCWHKPPPLLFFYAMTLFHVRELSLSEAPVAVMDSRSRARENCGIVFFLAEALKIGL